MAKMDKVEKQRDRTREATRWVEPDSHETISATEAAIRDVREVSDANRERIADRIRKLTKMLDAQA